MSMPGFLGLRIRHNPLRSLRSQSAGVLAVYFGYVALLIVLGIAVIVRIPRPVFPMDDAYITLHSAQALLSGHDPNYLGTPALSGVTSIIHVNLVALLMMLLTPLWAVMASLWLAALAYVLALARLAFANGANSIEAGLVVLAGLLSAYVPHHLANGMETGLALAGLTWALALASDPAARLKRWVPVLYAQMPFLRPELALVVLLLLLSRAWHRKENGASFASNATDTGWDIALVVAGALPWLVMYALNTGVPYPTTIAAKENFFAESCWSFADKWAIAWHHLKSLMGLFGVFGLAVVFLVFTPLGWLSLTFTFALMAAFVIKLPDGISHNEFRYMHILVPLIAQGVVSAFSRPWRWVRTAAMCVLIAGVSQSVWLLPDRWAFHRSCNRYTVTELEGVASWARDHLPLGSIVLVHDAGYISFATTFRLFDLVGLKSPEFLPLHKLETLPTCGLKRGDAVRRIAEFAHPNYIVVLGEWEKAFRVVEALRLFGWRLDPLRPVGDPPPSSVYQVYRMTPPATVLAHPLRPETRSVP